MSDLPFTEKNDPIRNHSL